MPQLDHLSFLSQIVFLIIFFVGFYFVLLHSFLPKLAMALKVRKWKLSGGSVASENITVETTKLHDSLGLCSTKAELAVSELFSGGEATGTSWRSGCVNILNNSDVAGRDAQVRFVQTFGELRGQSSIVEAHLKR